MYSRLIEFLADKARKRNDRNNRETGDGRSLGANGESPAMQEMKLLKDIGVEIRRAQEAMEIAKRRKDYVNEKLQNRGK